MYLKVYSSMQNHGELNLKISGYVEFVKFTIHL